MPCPTCDHTLDSIGTIAGEEGSWPVSIYHCPRCGTLRVNGRGHTSDYVPKLVERCRLFARRRIIAGSPDNDSAAWKELGIAESINLPADRPA